MFLNAVVTPEGRLVIAAPLSQAGDAIDFRAEMDLEVAITSCPAAGCNGGETKPVAYEILEP